jgi:hypothetical protein
MNLHSKFNIFSKQSRFMIFSMKKLENSPEFHMRCIECSGVNWTVYVESIKEPLEVSFFLHPLLGELFESAQVTDIFSHIL